MIALQLLIFFLIAAYIAYIYLRADHEKKRMVSIQNDFSLAEKKLQESEDRFQQVENEVFQKIETQFDEPYADHIKNGIVLVGMPATFLMMAWGHPHRIEKDETKRADEIWYYGAQGKLGLQTKVMIHNQTVTQLKDF